MIRNTVQILVWGAALAITSTALADTTGSEFPILEPLPVHPRATTFIVDQVRSNHLIRKLPLDDKASNEIFERYLEVLDRRKHFFLESDIEEFEQYRYSFDNDLKRGRLANAFHMMNRVQQRRDDRYGWILDRLELGIPSFDLKSRAQIPIETDELAWPANADVANTRWEHNLIDSIIHLKLNDHDLDQIQDLLTKRFKNRRNQNRQFTAEEAFADFINVFTSNYDPHTVYFSPRDAEDFHMSMRMSLEGIGALLGLEDEYVTVLSLVKGGPAELDGELKASDRIVSVGQAPDGPMIDVVGRRVTDVVDLIRGPRGTVVRLEVLGSVASGGVSKIVEITRDQVKLEEAAAKKKLLTLTRDGMDRTLGVIELPKMYADLAGEERRDPNYRSATRDVKRLIEELTEEGIEGLILDLRNNGGGSLPEAHKLVGLFIETGPTLQVKGLGNRRSIMTDKDSSVAYTGPLIVLVNRQSASASEIFAGAIQDYGRGLVVGSQTFGKGSVQTIMDLNHGELKITQARYYRITGESTQHDGVTPDITFPSLVDAESVGEDTHERALEADTIDAAPFEVFRDTGKFIDSLEEKHLARVENDPFFEYYNAVEDRIEFNRQTTHVSLNEHDRETRRKQNAAWRLRTENNYLIALGEEPVATIDALSRVMRELPQKFDDRLDGMVQETGRILLDYISTKPTLAYAEHASQ